MQIKKQQLKPDMEQQTGSKLGKEYVKTVYCHPTYLTYMQSTSEASLIAQLVKNLPAVQEALVRFLGQEDPLEKGWLTIPVFLDFPRGSASKESTYNVGHLGSIPGLGRSPGEGNGYPFQYSGLENSMDCVVHGFTKSWTLLSDDID